MEEMHHDLVFSPICVLSNRLLNAQFDRHTRTLRLIAFSGSSRTELTTTTFNQPEWRYHMYVLRSDPSLGDYVLQTCNESDAVLWHLVGNEAKQTILPAVEGSIRSPPCMIDTRIVLVRNDRMLLYRLPDLSSPVGLYPLRNITKQSTLVSFQSSEAVAILWTDKTTLYMSVLRANKAEPDTRSVKLPAACRDPHEVNLVGTMCGLSLILRINIRSVSELWYIDMTTLDVAFKQKEFLAEVYSRVTGMWVAGNSLLCSVEDIATSAVGTLYAFTPDHSDE